MGYAGGATIAFPAMISYVKAHACGNDFLIVDEHFAQSGRSDVVRALCARNSGVGADGVEFLNGRSIRLFNADGSEAEISGNGTRCVAAWLAHSEGLREVVLETQAGPRACRVVAGNGSHYEIESEMGVVEVSSRAEQVEGIGGVVVSTGNPHFVVFTESEDFSYGGTGWREAGKQIATSSRFPHGTNVEFVQVLTDARIAIRIYERGVGPTSSSGTGSCAAAAVSIVTRGLSHTLRVEAPGGAQVVAWKRVIDPMFLTGPADLIAKGEAFL